MDASVDTKIENCETHGEFESLSLKLCGKHMNWSGCPSCVESEQAQSEAERQGAEARERQMRIESRLKVSGIPKRFLSKNFETYRIDITGQAAARSVAMDFSSNFARHLERGTVLIFSGMPGTGKSHLAIAAAREIMKSNTALYTSAIDAVRMLRDTWQRNSERTETQVLRELINVDLLILDEVGMQYGKEAEQITMFDIIDKRHRDQRPMIILTNQNKTGLKEFLGDRSFDRLREGGNWVTFDWNSQRGATA